MYSRAVESWNAGWPLSVNPGTTELTRSPAPAIASAMLRVRDSRAASLIACTMSPGLEKWAQAEEMLTMLPPAIMSGELLGEEEWGPGIHRHVVIELVYRGIAESRTE